MHIGVCTNDVADTNERNNEAGYLDIKIVASTQVMCGFADVTFPDVLLSF